MFSLTPFILAATLIPGQVADAGAHAPSCAVENRPARIVRSVPVDYPDVAQSLGVTGTTKVRVDLWANGAIVGVSIARSSGNALLDMAALRAARFMTYAPEVRDCSTIGGSYAVEVNFS